MRIEQAIEELQEAKKSGVKNIIVGWWEESAFERDDDAEWASDCEFVDREMDWSLAHECLQVALRLARQESPKQTGPSTTDQFK